jgi:hypothetical protein
MTNNGNGHKQFGEKLNRVLSPSRAIDNAAHLKGRASALKETAQAFSAQGRQVFVHGFRGVGKSSVALTAARDMSPEHDPVLVFCSSNSTFYELVRDMCTRALSLDPLAAEKKSERRVGGSAKIGGFGADGQVVTTDTMKGVPLPANVNEAAELMRETMRRAPDRVFIIDEFDLLSDRPSHQLFGEFAKLLADSGANAKIIFCGVAEDLDQIFQAHPSTFRIFHPLKLDTLKLQPCLDIIEDAEKALGVEIERNSKLRIVQISDGFPYFVHLITEKLLWQWFNDPAKKPNITAPQHYEGALIDACSAAEPELRLSYDAVVKKYRSDGDIVLWALASGNELSKNLDTIFKDFENVYDQVPERLRPDDRLDRRRLNHRLVNMKRPAYHDIIESNGRGWYEFREKRMRGYARLRAAAQGVDLRADHPLA